MKTAQGLGFIAIAATLALAGCGDGGVNSTPTPTPTPTPVSYTKIADVVAADYTFHPVGMHISFDNSGTPFLSNGGTDAAGAGLTVAYKASTQTYTVTAPDGKTGTFGPAEFDSAGAITGVPGIYASVGTNTFQTWRPSVPTVGGVALSYTALAGWTYFDLTTGKGIIYGGVAGSSTVSSDMPKTGTATFASELKGNGFDSAVGTTQYEISNASGASATFSADFAAGTVSTSLHLLGVPTVPGGPATHDFGTFTGTGTIASGSSNFSGTFAGTATSGFAGGFFGPQAAEMGYNAYLTTSTAAAAVAVWGKKN